MDLQTFVLRVTIHCHGCKKKVRKVLKSIEGVQDVKVDAQLHKVMVTGTVDAETLIKRLHKSGKQALPWQHTPAKNPDPAPPTPAPAEDGSKDAAVADKKPAEEPQADSSDKKPEQETASEKKPETEKEAESEKKADKEEAAKPRSSDEAKKDGGEGAAAEPKAKGTEPAAAAKEAGDGEGEAKKKQSKPKDAAAAADRSLSPAPAPAPAHVPRYAHQEYNAPQPVMSYNMAQPRASVSHYAPQPEQGYSQQQQAGYSSSSMMLMQYPPPPAQQAYSQQAQPMQQWSPSYLYMPYPHASPESYYQDYYSPPGTHASPPPPPPLHDSYRLFDDENPNSCSVM